MKSTLVGVSCSLLLTLFLAVAVNANSKEFKDYMATVGKEITEKCALEVGFGQDDIKNMGEDPKKVDAGKFNCFAACLFKDNKIIVDGKINMEGLKDAIMDTYKDEPESVNKMNEIMSKCVEQVTDSKDDCEIAGMIMDCAVKEMKR